MDHSPENKDILLKANTDHLTIILDMQCFSWLFQFYFPWGKHRPCD